MSVYEHIAVSGAIKCGSICISHACVTWLDAIAKYTEYKTKFCAMGVFRSQTPRACIMHLIIEYRLIWILPLDSYCTCYCTLGKVTVLSYLTFAKVTVLVTVLFRMPQIHQKTVTVQHTVKSGKLLHFDT